MVYRLGVFAVGSVIVYYSCYVILLPGEGVLEPAEPYPRVCMCVCVPTCMYVCVCVCVCKVPHICDAKKVFLIFFGSSILIVC